jgi:hypothetical protein
MSQEKQRRQRSRLSPSPEARVAIAFMAPAAAAFLVGSIIGSISPADFTRSQSAVAPLLACVGIVSWFLGVRWYGLPAMGLRGKRPLFAGIGFAALGWVAFLLFRFIFVAILGFGPAGSGRAFIYLLLFEAFAVQLWTFGLLFHALADWRGPLTAAIGSGVTFGMVAFLLFQESFISNAGSFFYFLLWGILYGMIRLRTGSLLGIVMAQAMQSFTAWVVMAPPVPLPLSQLQYLYLAASAAYLVLIWRLWPKEEGDYRV